MKNKILSTLYLLVASFYAHGQTPLDKTVKEVNAPNFLVHQQLSPETIKFEYSAGLSRGVFENSADQGRYHLRHNTLAVSGYPVTLINKRQQQMYLGFGYVQDKYTSPDSDNGLSFMDETFQSVNLNLFLNTRIKGKFYWFSYLQAGVQGSHPFDEPGKNHNEIFLNKINYKANRNMNIGVGLAYASNLGKPMIIPAVTFVYSQPRYLINIDFPVKAEVEAILARGQWRPVVGVSFPSNTYYVKSIDQYFSVAGMRGYVGMRYRILDLLYLHAAWETGLGETFKMGSGSEREKVGTFSDQGRIVVSLNMQVARLIPLKGY